MISLQAAFPRLHHEVTTVREPARFGRTTARLSLFINGTAYDVRPIATDQAAAARAFRLRKFDGTEYDIAQTPGETCCDCPDFTFHREGIDTEGCKHIKALVACGLIAGPSAVPAAGVSVDGPEAGVTMVSANAQPATFLEVVEHEAMGYRAWGTAVGDFLGAQLGRIAQLIRRTGAGNPADHVDRVETYELELRDRDYERGFQDGFEAARRQFARPDDVEP